SPRASVTSAQLSYSNVISSGTTSDARTPSSGRSGEPRLLGGGVATASVVVPIGTAAPPGAGVVAGAGGAEGGAASAGGADAPFAESPLGCVADCGVATAGAAADAGAAGGGVVAGAGFESPLVGVVGGLVATEEPPAPTHHAASPAITTRIASAAITQTVI